MMTTITRLYRFSASHRLHSAGLSAAENISVYGKCNNPFGHGHDYVLEVSATGNLDQHTGLLLPLSKLDRLVQETVLQRFAYSNINIDVPQFEHLVPTTENVVLVITDLLQQNWEAYLGGVPARLHRVHIQETDRNGFEVKLNA
jgi:6-pyruvoyltetrahydropterin/6-carboxytetrahydropterin synthase